MVENGDDVDVWEGATGLNSWDDEHWTWPEEFVWPEGEIVSTHVSPSSTPSEAPKSDRALGKATHPNETHTERTRHARWAWT